MRRFGLFTVPVSVQCQIDTIFVPNVDNIAGSVDKWCGLWTTPRLSGMTPPFSVNSRSIPDPIGFLVTGGVLRIRRERWIWGQIVPPLCARPSGLPLGDIEVFHTIHNHYDDDCISYSHMFNVNDPGHKSCIPEWGS